MVYSTIKALEAIIKGLFPKAYFECDVANMLNVKIDGIPRYKTTPDGDTILDAGGRPQSTDFIYIEEPTRGTISVPRPGASTQDVPIVLSFCKFEPMHNTGYDGDTPLSKESAAVTRLQLREQIENEMVRPFLAALLATDWYVQHPETMTQISVGYPAPRFDANEVSVTLELTLRTTECIVPNKFRGGCCND